MMKSRPGEEEMLESARSCDCDTPSCPCEPFSLVGRQGLAMGCVRIQSTQATPSRPSMRLPAVSSYD